MFARVKKSGKYQYLQIVENRKEKGKVKQRVIATVGRMDQLQSKGRVETLIRSLSRFSEQTLMILSGNSDMAADAKKIGPVLIFERLWKETGIKAAIARVLVGRKFEFDKTHQPHQELRKTYRGEPDQPPRYAGGDIRVPRPQRRGQDHDHQDDGGTAPAD